MTKTLIVGNSHVAALAAAYKSLSGAKKPQVDFGSIPGGRHGGTGLYGMQASGKYISGFGTNPAGTLVTFKPQDYDQLFVCGGFPPPQQFINLARFGLSAQCLAACEDDLLNDNHSMHVIRILQDVSDRPITVMTNAYPLGNALCPQPQFDEALGVIQKHLEGFGVRFFEQPRRTLNEQFFTRDEYMISKDNRHLNIEGGQLVLEDIRNYLATS